MVQAWDLAVSPLRVATACRRIWIVHDWDRGGVCCSTGANNASCNACGVQQQHMDDSALQRDMVGGAQVRYRCRASSRQAQQGL